MPDPAPDVEEALELLARRPRDTFLRKYILGLLLAKPDAADAVRICRERGKDAAESLLSGLMRIAPQKFGCLASAAGSDNSAWSDPELTARLYANIHNHEELPSGLCTAIGESNHTEILREREGILARLRLISPKAAGEPNQRDLQSLYAQAQKVLSESGIAASGEMRHEASLSPIALLRTWNLKAGLSGGNNRHTLTGQPTAYGRGLSLAQARISCAMEVIERASAYADIRADAIGYLAGRNRLLYSSWDDLTKSNVNALDPARLGAPAESRAWALYWLEGQTARGEDILLPCQAVYLFTNLDEADLELATGSTGLAAGASMSQARLAAVTEIIERYAHASCPFFPDQCFELASRDANIQSLLDDYRWRGIRVQFQDITTEIGFPAYRCFVRGVDGHLAQATGASLCGAKACLAALTETPWPYAWATPLPAPSGRGLPDLPVCLLEDLPDLSNGTIEADLELTEACLAASGLDICYADLTRGDLGFPVCRAFIPGLEIDPELEKGPGPSLLAKIISNNARP